MDARRLSPVLLGALISAAVVLPPAAGAQVQQVAPDVEQLKVTPAAFKAATSGPEVITQGGGLVSFRLNGGANVRFSLKAERPGRKQGSKCVAGKTKNKKKQCYRTSAIVGSFLFPGISGDNELRISGRWAGVTLKPGRYRIVAKAEGLAARSSFARFTIVR
jgi:hypothetical protein